jgi:hypothetical protein
VTEKPPPLVDLHVAAALGSNGAAYAARLTSEGHTKTIDGLTSGTRRDTLREGIVAALDELKYSSAVTLFVPSGETVSSIRDMLNAGEPKRAASRHRIEVRFEWPAQVEREFASRARELASVPAREGSDEPGEPVWRKGDEYDNGRHRMARSRQCFTHETRRNPDLGIVEGRAERTPDRDT